MIIYNIQMFIQEVHRTISGLTGVLPVVERVSTSLVKDKNTLKLHNYLVTVIRVRIYLR